MSRGGQLSQSGPPERQDRAQGTSVMRVPTVPCTGGVHTSVCTWDKDPHGEWLGGGKEKTRARAEEGNREPGLLSQQAQVSSATEPQRPVEECGGQAAGTLSQRSPSSREPAPWPSWAGLHRHGAESGHGDAPQQGSWPRPSPGLRAWPRCPRGQAGAEEECTERVTMERGAEGRKTKGL